MKHGNVVRNMVFCLQVVQNLQFHERNKTLCVLYVIFLFVETKNDIFIKEIKYVQHAFIALWKPLQSMWEFSSRWKPSTVSLFFTHLLSNSPKCLPRLRLNHLFISLHLQCRSSKTVSCWQRLTFNIHCFPFVNLCGMMNLTLQNLNYFFKKEFTFRNILKT